MAIKNFYKLLDFGGWMSIFGPFFGFNFVFSQFSISCPFSPFYFRCLSSPPPTATPSCQGLLPNVWLQISCYQKGPCAATSINMNGTKAFSNLILIKSHCHILPYIWCICNWVLFSCIVHALTPASYAQPIYTIRILRCKPSTTVRKAFLIPSSEWITSAYGASCSYHGFIFKIITSPVLPLDYGLLEGMDCAFVPAN